MRRVIAFIAASFLLLHTVLAAPLAPPCCIGGCPATMDCAQGSCAGCAPAAAPGPSLQPVPPQPMSASVASVLAQLCEVSYAVWRPPG